jgi:hypothetical protein
MSVCVRQYVSTPWAPQNGHFGVMVCQTVALQLFVISPLHVQRVRFARVGGAC